jgi:hypothetical protein
VLIGAGDLVAKVGTSKAGGTISQLGCGTSVVCHGRPLKEEEAIFCLDNPGFNFIRKTYITCYMKNRVNLSLCTT